jgi:3-deoxy-7-phosphoheptulonate synthase
VSTWHPSSWRDFPAGQQPTWPSQDAVDTTLKRINSYPPLVFAGEARALLDDLAGVCAGEAFLLQAGDCAESFDAFNATSIRERLKLILQMAVVLTYSAGVPVVKVGRLAGQFAKPRSADTETQGDTTLPSFRGHIVNDAAFDADSRVPDATRLDLAYHQSAATLNLVRAFTKGGFADLNHVHQWNREFVANSPAVERYNALAKDIDRALTFMAACGINTDAVPSLHEVTVYTSHEALILGYEEALTRIDSLTDEPYDCSAHMLWIGERTRELGGAHVEFFRGIRNPIGCKVGPTATTDDVLDLCRTLNPDRIPGRLTLISRMGKDKVESTLRPLVRAVADEGHPVVWSCDPMHGNTFTSSSGRKTRHLDDILSEISGFFAAHEAEGTWPGGLHVELTADDVTECLGGGAPLGDQDLDLRYETICDPRLNGQQSLDLAFQVAELLQARR